MTFLDNKYNIKLRCYRLSKNVVLFVNRNHFQRVHASSIDQVLRSTTSIGANVIEAKSGNSKRNLVNFFSIALRSANETKYWLCLMRDTMSVNREEIKTLIKEADEISRILARSIMTIKKNL